MGGDSILGRSICIVATFLKKKTYQNISHYNSILLSNFIDD